MTNFEIANGLGLRSTDNEDFRGYSSSCFYDGIYVAAIRATATDLLVFHRYQAIRDEMKTIATLL